MSPVLGLDWIRISRQILPAHPAMRGDELEMPVALRRFGLGHLARHRCRARRDDAGHLGWRTTTLL